MAVNLSDLLALPSEQRLELAEKLMESVAPSDLLPVVREFVSGAERTNEMLQALLERLDRFDETLERHRTEVREAVLRDGDVWPFPVAATPQ